MFILINRTVSWKNSKQQIVADSTTEPEYVAASEAIKKDVWTKKLIIDLRVVPKIEGLVPLYFDNTGAVIKIRNLGLIINPSTSSDVSISLKIRCYL